MSSGLLYQTEWWESVILDRRTGEMMRGSGAGRAGRYRTQCVCQNRQSKADYSFPLSAELTVLGHSGGEKSPKQHRSCTPCGNKRKSDAAPNYSQTHPKESWWLQAADFVTDISRNCEAGLNQQGPGAVEAAGSLYVDWFVFMSLRNCLGTQIIKARLPSEGLKGALWSFLVT